MKYAVEFLTEKIYIIILNYNSAADTVECLRSLIKIELINSSQIILVDNKSTDNSELIIDDLLKNEFNDYAKYKKEKNNFINIHGTDIGTNIIFIKSDENKGFSAGNNIALDYISKKNDGNYFWFLNNDTVQDKYALTEMIGFMEHESLVLTSSVLYDYIMPRKIQAIGIALNRPIYTMPIVKDDFNCDMQNKCISYEEARKIYSDIYALPGASFMLSKKGLDLIGGRFDESYQFYFEEAEIARKLNGKARYAPCLSSVVWHKGGGSSNAKGSYFISYHTTRSCLLFVKRYKWTDLPFATAFIVVKAIYCYIQGRKQETLGMWDGLKKGLLYIATSEKK